MNIKPMLARLQCVMGANDLIEKMMLLPSSGAATQAANTVNLVVGYNSSPSSQTALDLTLWIAHQTRLATCKQVTVHVVYVLEQQSSKRYQNQERSRLSDFNSLYANSLSGLISVASGTDQPILKTLGVHPRITSPDLFEQADLILWQAKSLAAEWRGTLIAHLRFGDVAEELRAVVDSEAATLLFLGCNSAKHPLVQALGSATDFPCAVLGMDFATGKALACV